MSCLQVSPAILPHCLLSYKIFLNFQIYHQRSKRQKDHFPTPKVGCNSRQTKQRLLFFCWLFLLGEEGAWVPYLIFIYTYFIYWSCDAQGLDSSPVFNLFRYVFVFWCLFHTTQYNAHYITNITTQSYCFICIYRTLVLSLFFFLKNSCAHYLFFIVSWNSKRRRSRNRDSGKFTYFHSPYSVAHHAVRSCARTSLSGSLSSFPYWYLVGRCWCTASNCVCDEEIEKQEKKKKEKKRKERERVKLRIACALRGCWLTQATWATSSWSCPLLTPL